MQRNDVIEFLGKIDDHLKKHCQSELQGQKFELKIFGKSALMLAGLQDSVGTVDIDLLRVDGQPTPESNANIIKTLEAEFGQARMKTYGYFLQFVEPAVPFLPAEPNWVPLGIPYAHLSVTFLEPNHVAASKLFSAFSTPPRKRDKQDIVALLDQGLVDLKTICPIADKIFAWQDARSIIYPKVYAYLTEELMKKHGKVKLMYCPDDQA